MVMIDTMTDELPNRRWRLGVSDGGEQSEPAPEAVHLSLDKVFELLANPRRRLILSYLSETAADAVDFADLIAEVVARETDSETDAERYEAVAIELRHTHLPKLADAGLVDYDERSRTIRFYGHPLLEAYLELAEDVSSRTGGHERSD